MKNEKEKRGKNEKKNKKNSKRRRKKTLIGCPFLSNAPSETTTIKRRLPVSLCLKK